MKKYVLGFLFSEDKKAVVLIKKNRPDWQKGLWNGVGGHIEKNELPISAFIREFKEETGVLLSDNQVSSFGVMRFKSAEVFLFRAFNSKLLCNVKTTTDETIRIFYLDSYEVRSKSIYNLSWLIPMALSDVVGYAKIEHSI